MKLYIGLPTLDKFYMKNELAVNQYTDIAGYSPLYDDVGNVTSDRLNFK